MCEYSFFRDTPVTDETYTFIDQLVRGDGAGVDHIPGLIASGWAYVPEVSTLHADTPSRDFSSLRARLRGASTTELRICDLGNTTYGAAYAITFGCLEQVRQKNHGVRSALAPSVKILLARQNLHEATPDTLRQVAHPHLFAAMIASHVHEFTRAIGGLPHELSDVWQALSSDEIRRQFDLSVDITAGLVEMDENDAYEFNDEHGVNLERMKVKLAGTASEFTIRRWGQTVEGITSLQSSGRLTAPDGQTASKRLKLTSRDKLFAKIKSKPNSSSSSSAAATPGRTSPSTPHSQQPSLDDSDIRVAACALGAPYLLLRLAPGSGMALVHGTQYARGVVPHEGPDQDFQPVTPHEFTPFTSGDPLLADEDGNALTVAIDAPTSSYDWILRYNLRYPGHLIIVSNKNESGRISYGTITRAMEPPFPRPPLPAAPSAATAMGSAAGEQQQLPPPPLGHDDDTFIDDGDDDDEEEGTTHGKQPDDTTGSEVDMDASPTLVKTTATLSGDTPPTVPDDGDEAAVPPPQVDTVDPSTILPSTVGEEPEAADMGAPTGTPTRAPTTHDDGHGDHTMTDEITAAKEAEETEVAETQEKVAPSAPGQTEAGGLPGTDTGARIDMPPRAPTTHEGDHGDGTMTDGTSAAMETEETEGGETPMKVTPSDPDQKDISESKGTDTGDPAETPLRASATGEVDQEDDTMTDGTDGTTTAKEAAEMEGGKTPALPQLRRDEGEADAPHHDGVHELPAAAQPPFRTDAGSGTPTSTTEATPAVGQQETDEELRRQREYSAGASSLSRAQDQDLDAIHSFLGDASLARTAVYAAHAHEPDPSRFSANNDEPSPPNPMATYAMGCQVWCHSALWASEAAIDVAQGEWTRGVVHSTFDDGSVDIFHETPRPGGAQLERVYHFGRLRMIPDQGATTAAASNPLGGPCQVSTPPTPQTLSPTPDLPSPGDPIRLTDALKSTRFTDALNLHGKAGDVKDQMRLRDFFSRAIQTLYARIDSHPDWNGNTKVGWVLSQIIASGEQHDDAAKKMVRAAIDYVKSSPHSASKAIDNDKGC